MKYIGFKELILSSARLRKQISIEKRMKVFVSVISWRNLGYYCGFHGYHL